MRSSFAQVRLAFGHLEALRDQLQLDIAEKDRVIRRLSGMQDSHFLPDDDRMQVENDNGQGDQDHSIVVVDDEQELQQQELVVLSEEEEQAAALYAAHDYQGAVNLYSTIQTPSGLYAFVCLAVRHFFERLEEDEEFAEQVHVAFDLLREKYKQASSECETERATFLGGIVEDVEGAMDAYQRAIALNPEDANVLYNYANFISFEFGSDSEMNAMAEDLYRQALEIDPDMVLAVNNLAAMLVEKCRALASADQRSGLEEARALFTHAQNLAPGLPAYNLACIDALLGNFASCQPNLELAINSKAVTPADLLVDDDLSAVRKEAWFQRLCRRRE